MYKNNNEPYFVVDMCSAEYSQSPYPILELLRNEYPVYRFANNTYALSRYKDVRVVLARDDLFSVGWGAEPVVDPLWLPDECKRGGFLGDKNQPELGEYIKIIDSLFAGRSTRAMLPLIQQAVRRLVIQAQQSPNFDFVADFAYPLAGETLAPMIGLPLDTKPALAAARYWVEFLDSPYSLEPPPLAEKTSVEAFVIEQNRQFDALINARREIPHNDDLATLLVNARIDGEPLPASELRGALNQFVIAGLTPALFLPSAIVVLAERPELYRQLQTQPEKIPAFIDELLRFESVGQAMVRVAISDITMHGITIPAGARVLALIGSANRDSAQFPNADQFQLDRDNVKSHFSFGHGAHRCMGTALAKLQLKVALEEILSTFNTVECPSPPALNWYSSGITRSLRTLPVHFA